MQKSVEMQFYPPYWFFRALLNIHRVIISFWCQALTSFRKGTLIETRIKSSYCFQFTRNTLSNLHLNSEESEMHKNNVNYMQISTILTRNYLNIVSMKFPPKKTFKNNILKLQTFSHETEFSINCHQINLKIKVRCTAHNMTTNSLKYNINSLIKLNILFHVYFKVIYNSTESLQSYQWKQTVLPIQLGALLIVFLFSWIQCYYLTF